MLADFFQWIVRRPTPAYEAAFVAEVRVAPARELRPTPRVTRIILVCWILIALKHVAVLWAVPHYHVPFSPLWVNAPTWILATLATLLYYRRE